MDGFSRCARRILRSFQRLLGIADTWWFVNNVETSNAVSTWRWNRMLVYTFHTRWFSRSARIHVEDSCRVIDLTRSVIWSVDWQREQWDWTSSFERSDVYNAYERNNSHVCWTSHYIDNNRYRRSGVSDFHAIREKDLPRLECVPFADAIVNYSHLWTESNRIDG